MNGSELPTTLVYLQGGNMEFMSAYLNKCLNMTFLFNYLTIYI